MTGTEPHAWETGLMDNIIYVGLDVHTATVRVAVAEGGQGGEIRQLGVFDNRPELLRKLAAWLSKGGHCLSFCYEAGPCGYGLHRLLTDCGHDCVVVAPSLIPMKAADRVETDRRDALMLAKLHRAGELTPTIRIPRRCLMKRCATWCAPGRREAECCPGRWRLRRLCLPGFAHREPPARKARCGASGQIF
jgi:hypothetical protein